MGCLHVGCQDSMYKSLQMKEIGRKEVIYTAYMDKNDAYIGFKEA